MVLFFAAVVYGGTSAAIDLGGGLEASHVASDLPVSESEHQSVVRDEHEAFHDAEKQALIAVIGGAGLAFTRKRNA